MWKSSFIIAFSHGNPALGNGTPKSVSTAQFPACQVLHIGTPNPSKWNVGYKRLAFCTRVKFLQVTMGCPRRVYMCVEHGMTCEEKGGIYGDSLALGCLRIEIPVSSQEKPQRLQPPTWKDGDGYSPCSWAGWQGPMCKWPPHESRR